MQADKEAEKAYQRSLGNIPNHGPTDPWGDVRTESRTKPAAKTSSAKRPKPNNPAN
jgi:SAM-dependent methyltransferase